MLGIIDHHPREHEMGVNRLRLLLGWRAEWSILLCSPRLTDSQSDWPASITILLPLPTPSVATQICLQALRKPVGSALQSIFAQVLSFQTSRGVLSYDARQHGSSRETRPSDFFFLISRLEEKCGRIHGAAAGSAAFT